MGRRGPGAPRRRRPWIFDNLGSAAMVGQVVHLAAIWGGPADLDLGWLAGGGEEGRAGLLPPGLLAATERRLSVSRPSAFDSVEFFARVGDEIYAIGASHFEPVEHAESYSAQDRFSGQLVMGIRMDEDVLHQIADSILLHGAVITAKRPQDRPSLLLPGPDGEAVAWIAWDLPRPGTDLLRRMLPLLALVSAAAAVLAVLGMMLMRRNAHDLVGAEKRASGAARTDTLTGLPNRAAFQEALAASEGVRERAILFLDVNGFKGINDSLGHGAGDEVIVAMASRLAELQAPDALLARISGDEFVLLVQGSDVKARVGRLAGAIDRSFDAPFVALGHPLHLDAAIGYAVQEDGGMTGADLVRQADLAMYEGKRLKQRQPIAFGSILEEASQNAFFVERGLREALTLRPGEIWVAYQPIVSPDGRFIRAEALARWTSVEHGEVPPSRFIAIAEKAGLVVELGRLILAQVCSDLAAYPDLRVSMNISALQLGAPGFIPDLLADLAARSIAPGRVEVELTESVLIRDSRLAAQHLQQLRTAGLSVALDDFGTGYSSVAYLDQLAFDTLKIDRSFVSGVRHSPKRHALLRAMVQMAHGLDLKVTCEGVETGEDLMILRELGSDFMQGYHFDRPLAIGRLAVRWLGIEGSHAAA